MPTLAPKRQSWFSKRIGRPSSRMIRSARFEIFLGVMSCVQRTTNSSPPMRATKSPGRTLSLQDRRGMFEHRVAGAVAECVVDLLETVEVDMKHG
jgi:hypothetical protein